MSFKTTHLIKIKVNHNLLFELLRIYRCENYDNHFLNIKKL